MKIFEKVVIVGTGLIGGSIALAIKKKKLAGEVWGVSRRRESLVSAKRIGAIDYGSQDMNIAKDADLVILAVPVNTILDMAERISKIVKPRCIICDVGSSKQQIVSRLDKLFDNFVGTHPMAGSEKKGVIHASYGLFAGSVCIITPTRKTNQQAFKRIKDLWKALGAQVVCLDAFLHDKMVSYISHLPHIVVFALMGIIPDKYLKFASGGLKDTTRIAASDSFLWRDIFLSNRRELLKSIKSFENNLTTIKMAVDKGDGRKLVSILKRARKKRDLVK